MTRPSTPRYDAFLLSAKTLSTLIIVKDFKGISLHGPQPQGQGRPWIGLEHTNKVRVIAFLCKFYLFIFYYQFEISLTGPFLFRLTRDQDIITWRRL